jgi:uncharacterized membrane protein YedE/YeeE
VNAPPRVRFESREPLIVYFLLGIFLGIIFIKSEVGSWYRIQEMFRFQAFHMYGVIASGVATAALSVFLMKRFGVRSAAGGAIDFTAGVSDRPGKEHVLGGTLFGLGWGLVGVCPGPIYALIGAGYSVMLLGLLSAVAGAWFYGLLRPRLPHGPIRAAGRTETELARAV